jgi:hypothetical protein
MQPIAETLTFHSPFSPRLLGLILWRVDPLPAKDLETNNEHSRCYAIGKQTGVYNDSVNTLPPKRTRTQQ